MHITGQEHTLQYLGEFITITKWLSSEYLIKLNHYLGSLTHHLSRSLKGRWGIKDDRVITFLHSSLSSAFRRASSNPIPAHSDILSFHLHFCLPFLLPSCTVPCRIIFASLVDLFNFMCPYHLNLRFLRVVIRSSYDPIACLIVFSLLHL